MNQNLNFNDWFNLLDTKNSEELCELSMVFLVCWQIWKDRNQVIFQNKNLDYTRIVYLAFSLGREYWAANMQGRNGMAIWPRLAQFGGLPRRLDLSNSILTNQ